MRNFFTLILLAIASLSFAQPGTLLSSFGNGGKATTDMGTPTDLMNDIAVQSDGKIIAVGSVGTGSDLSFAVARYNADGTLDNAFNGNGKVITDISSGPGAVNSVAIQRDGKILVAGGANNGGSNVFTLVRYNSDGTLDHTFDGDGIALSNIPSVVHFAGQAVYVLNDGKILVAGAINNGSDLDFVLARFNSDGSMDATFDGDGYVQTTFDAGTIDEAFDLLVQTDGKIIVGGRSRVSPTGIWKFAVARYNADGSLDNGFASGGKFMYAVSPTSSNEGQDMALQKDGKIVVAGYTDAYGNPDMALLRLNADGTLDNTFNSNGTIALAFYGYGDGAEAVQIQANGKILFAGYTSNGTDNDFALGRLNEDGSIDNSFGDQGGFNVPNTDDDGASAMAFFGTTIYLGGTTTNGSESDFMVTAHVNDVTAILLPLAFTDFSAVQLTDAIQLRWKTGNEENAAYFDVEKGANDRSFANIGRVAAHGTHRAETFYEFKDNNPSPLSYYRIKAVDKDGKALFSKIITVRADIAAARVQAFPNPVTNTLQIQTSLQGALRIIIHDMNGKTVKTVSIEANDITTAIPVDVANLSAGTYSLIVKGTASTETVLFVKK